MLRYNRMTYFHTSRNIVLGRTKNIMRQFVLLIEACLPLHVSISLEVLCIYRLNIQVDVKGMNQRDNNERIYISRSVSLVLSSLRLIT